MGSCCANLHCHLGDIGGLDVSPARMCKAKRKKMMKRKLEKKKKRKELNRKY